MPRLGEGRVRADAPVVVQAPTPEVPDEMRLAVNLFDLDRVDPQLRTMLLGGKIDPKNPIRTHPDRMEETAIAFVCDLLQAATICDILRGHDRQAGDYPTRLYIWRKSAWTRIPGATRLTIEAAEIVQLNPDVFGVATVAPPPPVRRARFGAG